MPRKKKEPKKSASVGKRDSDEQFIIRMRERLDRSVTNEKDERTRGIDDTKFINGEQWDESVKSQRGKGRLCLTINKLPASLDQIDGDIRLNKPGIKVKAVDSVADPETASVLEGLVRYIERTSGAGRVYSYAGVHSAAGGRGAWRVLTKYVTDSGFDQDIVIERIINPYAVYFDPTAINDDKQDGQYFFIVSDIPKEEYKERYKHDPVDFEVDGSEFANWQTETSVRVAEYYYKEKVGEREIHLLEDGALAEGPTRSEIKRTRKVPVYKIKWAKVDGKRVLDREDVPGNMFPIVLTWGKQLCIDGKVEVRGIARYSKDAQRLYNYFRSNDAEAAALQPKQPYLMPDTCLGQYKDVWDKSIDENYPYLPYKVDPSNPNLRPVRERPGMASGANREQIMVSDSEIRDTVGIQKAALGMESNEKSGVAIEQRKMESDTGQFAYLDNLAAGVRVTGKIIVGMIPEVFDTERQLRILGKDFKEKLVNVNDGQGIDLTVGRYDVDIDSEGSYSTQREEFQQKIERMLPQIPQEQIAVISDILFQMQDFPRADDIAERIKKTIPPEILGNDAPQEDEQPIGPTSPEGEPLPAEQPDPMMMAELQAKEIELQTAQVKLEQEQAKLEGMRIDNELKGDTKKEDIMALVEEMMNEEESEATE